MKSLQHKKLPPKPVNVRPAGTVLPQHSLARNLSAAEVAGLPKLRVVFVKDLADAAGLCERTIRDRLHLWESDPSDPRAIPYLRHLGKPFRIRQEVAERLLKETAA